MHQENNISQEAFELIERYLNNELEGQALTDFEEKLQNDQSFREQVEDVRTISAGIERAVLKENMESFHSEMPPETPVININRRKLFLKIAVAACFIFGFVLMFNYYQNDPNEKLYQAYYTPDPGLPTVMGSSNEYDFNEAMVDYKRENYASAIQKWSALYEDSPGNDTLNYFLGMAFMASDEVDKAVPFLESVSTETESEFYEDALYYTGLYHLKKNNIELAKQYFNKINTTKSKELLEKLNEL